MGNMAEPLGHHFAGEVQTLWTKDIFEQKTFSIACSNFQLIDSYTDFKFLNGLALNYF